MQTELMIRLIKDDKIIGCMKFEPDKHSGDIMVSSPICGFDAFELGIKPEGQDEWWFDGDRIEVAFSTWGIEDVDQKAQNSNTKYRLMQGTIYQHLNGSFMIHWDNHDLHVELYCAALWAGFKRIGTIHDKEKQDD